MSSPTKKPSGLYAFYKQQNIFFKVLLFCPFVLYFLVVCITFSPVFIFLGAVGLYAYADLIVRAILTKIAMARNQRDISLKILGVKLTPEMPSGTFIFEAYTLGWPVGRIWWTSDVIQMDDSSTTSTTDPTEAASTPHQQWIYDTYLDLKKGTALLVIAWTRKNTLAKLYARFPFVPLVKIWSGAIMLKREIELRKQT